MNSGSFSGETAVSSTNGIGFAGPGTFIIKPNPALRIAHIFDWSLDLVKI